MTDRTPDTTRDGRHQDVRGADGVPRSPVVRLHDELDWDRAVDVVVVGGGVAGMSTAVFCADRGASVLVLDRGEHCGGTTRKAAAGMMIPNNAYMRERGQEDPKEDFIRFLARVGRPLLYEPDAPRSGLPAWEYELIETYYDHAAPAIERLDEIGALRTIHAPDWSSYNEVPEDRARFGRVVFTRRPDGTVGNGRDFMQQMLAAAERAGVEVRTSHRVSTLVLNEEGEAIGVVVEGSAVTRVRARKAVVYASGGFTHNEELRREYLNGMYVGGCAAVTSQGDFVAVAKALGLPLVHMHSCWGAPVLLEQALDRDPDLIAAFAIPGDSIVVVNRYGVRVGNEKTTYNDRTQQHFAWDPAEAEYPHFLLFPIWDERNARLFPQVPGELATGNFIPPAGGDHRYVLHGDSLEDLARALDDRLRSLGWAARGVRLSPAFADSLAATIRRFNELARSGRDVDFRRGETAIERLMHGGRAPDNDLPNETMFPLADNGPYYATILAPGAIETKGGPKVNARLQVLDADERPVPGLYGVGNCVASPSGQAYWSGGSTFGPYIAYGYAAAAAIAEEPFKELGARAAQPAGAAGEAA